MTTPPPDAVSVEELQALSELVPDKCYPAGASYCLCVGVELYFVRTDWKKPVRENVAHRIAFDHIIREALREDGWELVPVRSGWGCVDLSTLPESMPIWYTGDNNISGVSTVAKAASFPSPLAALQSVRSR